jgi:hypothetical protein
MGVKRMLIIVKIVKLFLSIQLFDNIQSFDDSKLILKCFLFYLRISMDIIVKHLKIAKSEKPCYDYVLIENKSQYRIVLNTPIKKY